MAHKDTKTRSWKFWQRWAGTTGQRRIDAQDTPLSASTSTDNSTEDTEQDQHEEVQEHTLGNAWTGATTIEEIDRLKEELDALRPLPPDVLGRIETKTTD